MYGYYLAANNLLAQTKESGADRDLLVFPICYLFRHTIELQLKSVICLSRQLFDEPVNAPKHHKILDLWTLSKGFLRRAEPGKSDPVEFRRLDEIIKNFAEVDYDAQAFRFPTASDDLPTLTKVHEISLSEVGNDANFATLFLGGCEDWLGEFLDFKNWETS
ncbi:hypothetical protein [Novipirellula sp.]|uniref:hypothetical protein n=1 Tax=Novipirellula sp. TaxID=2795430 RepID=UPI003562109A